MPRSPGSGRSLDLQLLKQALASTSRAIELFIKEDDVDSVAQAELAWRFLDEFIDNRQTREKRR